MSLIGRPAMRRSFPPRLPWAALACLFVVESVVACSPQIPIADAAPTIESRRAVDDQFRNWCEFRKGLPETAGVCACVTDQLHVQGLPDDAARRLVALVDGTGDGSDPAFSRLPS